MTTLLAISFTSVYRGAIGMATLILIAWVFSNNKKKIDWMLVGKGLAIQLIFAILVLKVPFVETGFEWVSRGFTKVIGFTQQGTMFLFSSFISGEIESSLVNFVVMVLPTIVFFSALTSLFYYWGILQKIVYVFAWVMKKAMKLSGAESLAAAGNIFLGQTEAPLLVKPYLNKMTNSELMCLMSGGMATIAGGVLAAYIGFLGGDDPVQQVYFAKHLLAASVMSAPAAVVAAKILVPETEKFDEKLEITKEKIGSNALEAITNGTTDGIKLAVNVGGMLLVFIALMAMGNYVLLKIGALTYKGYIVLTALVAGGLLLYILLKHFLNWPTTKRTTLIIKTGGFLLVFTVLMGVSNYLLLKFGGWTNLNHMIVTNTAFDGLSFQFVLGYLFAPIAWLMGVCYEDMVLVGQLLGEKTILNEFVAYVSLGDMKNAGKFAEEKSVIMATYILCGFANFASIGIQIGGIGSLAPDRKAALAKFGFRALIGGTLASLFTAVIVGMLL